MISKERKIIIFWLILVLGFLTGLVIGYFHVGRVIELNCLNSINSYETMLESCRGVINYEVLNWTI